MRDKTVADAMTPLESVFMLDVNGVIDRKTIREVPQHIVNGDTTPPHTIHNIYCHRMYHTPSYNTQRIVNGDTTPPHMTYCISLEVQCTILPSGKGE